MPIELLVALAGLSVIYWVLIPPAHRLTFLIAVSLIMLYGLQPIAPISSLNWVLPTTTVLIVMGTWSIVRQPSERLAGQWRDKINGIGLAVFIIGLVLVAPHADVLLTLMTNLLRDGIQTQLSIVLPTLVIAGAAVLTMPNQRRWWWVLIAVGALMLFVRFSNVSALNFRQYFDILADSLPSLSQRMWLMVALVVNLLPFVIRVDQPVLRRRFALAWLILILALLVIVKVDALSNTVSFQLNIETNRLKEPFFSFQWLGLSYVAFRLMHVLLDFRADDTRVTGSLADFIAYTLFFPSLLAGPITRAEQMLPQLAQTNQPFQLDLATTGMLRLLVGLFKKFVLADSLALIAAQSTLFQPGTSPLSAWLMLYAFFFRLYLDFSGYSDIAIGLGALYGIRLPENFDNPFLKPNLSLFWQSWHITLSTWFRQYWFNPLTRRLMKSGLKKHQNWIVLIAQVTTMVLIGLWHRAALNWIAWGAWHGVGLFAYKALGDANRQRFRQWMTNPRLASVLRVTNIVITFHFVMLSMAFIAFDDLSQGWRFLLTLFGIHQ